MLQTLRSRLMLSHILPLIVILPLAGIALVYFLEMDVLLPRITDRVVGDARLIVEVTRNQPEVWSNPAFAENLLSQANPNPVARAMLLSPDGRLIASTNSADQSRLGQNLDLPGFDRALKGQVIENVFHGATFDSESIDVLAPAVNSNGRLVGVVDVTYYFSSVYADLLQLRSIIGFILLVCMLVGGGMGLALAINIIRPIEKVTAGVYDLAYGNMEALPIIEEGPEEIQTLAQAVDFLAERLHHLEQYRQQLLANLIHELGRSLGALHTANLALLRGAASDPELSKDLIRGMEDEITSLQRLLDDLSRLRENALGTFELERQPVALSQWLPGMLLPWQQMALDKGLNWQSEIPGDLPVIDADVARISQALGNLISNAIKFTPETGKVCVSSGVEGNNVWIRVCDSGPGITTEDQQKIFTPFYRGSQRKHFTDGMGLGLGIARDLVLAHGGRLTIESEPGKGSQFTIWLPETVEQAVQQLHP